VQLRDAERRAAQAENDLQLLRADMAKRIEEAAQAAVVTSPGSKRFSSQAVAQAVKAEREQQQQQAATAAASSEALLADMRREVHCLTAEREALWASTVEAAAVQEATLLRALTKAKECHREELLQVAVRAEAAAAAEKAENKEGLASVLLPEAQAALEAALAIERAKIVALERTALRASSDIGRLEGELKISRHREASATDDAEEQMETMCDELAASREQFKRALVDVSEARTEVARLKGELDVSRLSSLPSPPQSTFSSSPVHSSPPLPLLE
jgi:hypothetical protein